MTKNQREIAQIIGASEITSEYCIAILHTQSYKIVEQNIRIMLKRKWITRTAQQYELTNAGLKEYELSKSQNGGW